MHNKKLLKRLAAAVLSGILAAGMAAPEIFAADMEYSAEIFSDDAADGLNAETAESGENAETADLDAVEAQAAEAEETEVIFSDETEEAGLFVEAETEAESAEAAETFETEQPAEEFTSEEADAAGETTTGTSGDYTYEISASGLSITGYTGTAETVNIPSELAGYKVTSIGKQAFKENYTIKNLTIPETVTSISCEAFYGCSGLSVINFNAKNCTIPDIWIYSGDKGAGVFSGAGSASASGLTVNFGSQVTKIPDNLFNTASGTEYGKKGYSYAYVTAVNFNSATTEIGDYAFWNCQELGQVTLGSAVTKIGAHAFEGCISVTSFTASNVLAEIGDNAFAGCTGLKTITWGSGLGSIGAQAFYGCTAITELNLPDPLDSVGRQAFMNCTALTSVVLPKSLTKLKAEAFYDCSKLNSLTVNSTNLTVPEVWIYSNDGGAGVFSGAGSASASGLSVVFGSNVTKICANLFDTASITDYGHKGDDFAYVTSVTIPSSVTYIGNYAFRNCQKLGKVTLTNCCDGIGTDVFYGCTENPDFKIAGYKDGKPVAYAIENSLPYEILSETAALSAPKLKSAKSAGAKKIKITWEKVSDADGYRVFVKINKKWKRIGNTTATSYTYKKAVTGRKYTFTVRAYKKKDSGYVWSKYNKTGITGKAVPAAPVLKKVKKNSTKIGITWKKVSGATGYAVFRKTGNGKWKRLKYVKNATAYIDKNVKSGVKYTYTVRAYVKVNGKVVYGSYNKKGLSIVF